MKKVLTRIAFMFVTIALYNCGSNNQEKEVVLEDDLLQISLPQDVANTCSVSDSAFALWFADGKVTENGFVNPANSVSFNAKNNCSFYTWSEQMFLWLTSNGKKYNGGPTVFESPVFYTVSPLNDNLRELIPYKQGDPLDAGIEIAKVTTEEGQATSNVLLDRHGNVVYYITFVNDVYVALLNMAAQNGSSVNEFPTTQTDLNKILAFAKKNQIDIKEPNALAMELKTSWVKLEGDMKKEDFVTIESDIPVYDKKSDSLWVLNGKTTTATLALVGVHIVGGAAGHPEMIWSTFEHKYNTPNAKYQYLNIENKVINVSQDNSGYWLFNSNPKDTSIVNASFASFSSDSIIAQKGQTIQPSNSIRVLPWGSAYDVKPNQEDATAAAANSQVIAINNSIINKLAPNDVRKNYLFIGSTWTFNGVAPNGKAYSKDTVLAGGTAIGTSNLANSTMETNFQEKSPYVASETNVNTCFTCHRGKDKNGNYTLDPKIDDGLSHIFLPLMNGLKPESGLKKK